MATAPKKLKGVFAAAVTPIDANGEPDLARLTAHCQWLLANGCDGLAPFGTTGEGNSISVEGRLRIIEALAPALPKQNMLFGVGCTAVADTVKLTRASLAAGCPNVLSLPPFYYKNPSVEGLYAYFAKLIDDVGDSRLGLYLYHFPAQAVVGIPHELIERLLKAYPNTVMGMKDSTGDWAVTESYCKAFPGFAVFSGSEGLLVNTLEAGGAGCISATVNITAPLARKVFDAWAGAKDTAEAQASLGAARAAIQKFPLIPAMKALTALRSGDEAFRACLPPNVALPKSEDSALIAAVAPTGLLGGMGSSVAAQ